LHKRLWKTVECSGSSFFRKGLGLLCLHALQKKIKPEVILRATSLQAHMIWSFLGSIFFQHSYTSRQLMVRLERIMGPLEGAKENFLHSGLIQNKRHEDGN
jgi:hypothetical protein